MSNVSMKALCMHMNVCITQSMLDLFLFVWTYTYIYCIFACCILNKHINIPERNCFSGIKTVLESVRSYISDNYCFLVICMQAYMGLFGTSTSLY